MSSKLAKGNCGDDVAVNNKAVRIICQLYGISIPSFRCASHSSDGFLKRLVLSKTMNAPKVFELDENLSPVVRFFPYSVKNKEDFGNAVKMLNMRLLPVRSGSRAAATSKMERFVIIVNGFQ